MGGKKVRKDIKSMTVEEIYEKYAECLYNGDVKLKYLQYCKETKKKVESSSIELYCKQFKAISMLENSKPNDLGRIDKKDIVEFLIKRREKSLPTLKTLINNYKKWYCDNYSSGIPVEISRTDEERILASYNADYEGLAKELLTKKQLDTIIKDTNRVQNSLLLLLLFEGLDGNDCLHLKNNDIVENNYFSVNNKDKIKLLRIPQNIIELIRNRNNNETELMYVEGELLKDGYTKSIHLEYSDNIFRLSSGNANNDIGVLTYNTILNRLKAVAVYNNIKELTPTLLANSGIMHYTYIAEKYLGIKINKAIIKSISLRCNVKGESKLVKLEKMYPYYKARVDLENPIVTEDEIGIVSDLLEIKKSISSKQTAFDSLREKSEGQECKSSWVNENNETGYRGEYYILSALREISGSIKVKNVEDSYGYDVAIDNPRKNIEVKSSKSSNLSFHISLKELECYEENKDLYTLILVKLDANFQPVDTYVMEGNNEMLDDCLNMRKTHKSLRNTIIEASNFQITPSSNILTDCISFEEFLERLKGHILI